MPDRDGFVTDETDQAPRGAVEELLEVDPGAGEAGFLLAAVWVTSRIVALKLN